MYLPALRLSNSANGLHSSPTVWAAYRMTAGERGVSALLVQRQVSPSCHETAWMMLH